MIAMRGTWALLFLVVGCAKPEDYPPPGGNTDAHPADAAPDMPAPPETVTGTVCTVADLRLVADCTASGTGSLTVAIGGVSTTTNANGSFQIDKPAGATEWTVSGTGFIKSIIPFDPADTARRLPVVKATVYADLLTNNNVVLQAGQGSVLAQVVDGAGAPLADATAVVNKSGATQSFYDGDDPVMWDTDATGVNGMAWLPNSPTGPQTLLVTTTSAPKSFAIDVGDQAITFVTVKP